MAHRRTGSNRWPRLSRGNNQQTSDRLDATAAHSATHVSSVLKTPKKTKTADDCYNRSLFVCHANGTSRLQLRNNDDLF